jgi:two-component system, OmpR family, phosphate regulon response regulator PhoB
MNVPGAKEPDMTQRDRNLAQKPRILVVEDEDALNMLLEYNLSKAGFEVRLACDGEEALMMIDEEQPDLVILDWMLPNVSGIEVCRRLRLRTETRNMPILILTARGQESDRIRGLETGADDYLVKPFSMAELAARVRAILRRIRPGVAEDEVVFGDISLDRVAHKVRRAGRDIHLGPTEFRLLDHFMRNPGRVFSREHLLNAVWGNDVYVETRTVDVHIGRLRKALSTADGADPIRTVRSAGYAQSATQNSRPCQDGLWRHGAQVWSRCRPPPLDPAPISAEDQPRERTGPAAAVCIGEETWAGSLF